MTVPILHYLNTRGYDFWSNYLLLISMPKHVWSTEILSDIDDHPNNSLRRRTFGPFEFKYGENFSGPNRFRHAYEDEVVGPKIIPPSSCNGRFSGSWFDRPSSLFGRVI